MSAEAQQTQPHKSPARVIEVNLDYTAWYWIYHPEESKKLRFWLHKGRLLLGQEKKTVGVNLADVAAQSWAAQASAEELAGVRTVKAGGPETFDMLKSFPNLEALECASLRDEELDVVCSMGHPLRMFYLSWCESLKSPAALSKLQKLIRLILTDCPVLDDVSSAGKITGLERLDIISCNTLWDLEPLAPLKKLGRLVLRNCDGIRKLVPLAVMPELTSIDLSRCGQISELQPLAKLTKVASLDLSNCQSVQNIRPLSALVNLNELWLYGCKKVRDLRPIYKLTNLSKLSMPPAISDGDLLGVCLSHTQLKELDLRDCILITELEPINNVKELQILNLGGCRNVRNVAPLAGLKKLTRLDLAYCPDIEDIAPLQELKQLKELYVGGCVKLTREQVQKFREAVPGCDVRTV